MLTFWVLGSMYLRRGRERWMVSCLGEVLSSPL